MDKQNLMPQPAQPVNRIATGQLPTQLAELSEFSLSQFADAPVMGAVLPSSSQEEQMQQGMCSYNGDDVG